MSNQKILKPSQAAAMLNEKYETTYTSQSMVLALVTSSDNKDIIQTFVYLTKDRLHFVRIDNHKMGKISTWKRGFYEKTNEKLCFIKQSEENNLNGIYKISIKGKKLDVIVKDGSIWKPKEIVYNQAVIRCYDNTPRISWLKVLNFKSNKKTKAPPSH